jgi:alkylation response protein AidB-like acyl-CoA dehydrogenase
MNQKPTVIAKEADGWVDEQWNETLTVGEWWARLADAGYAAPQLPVDAGGRGYDRAGTEAVRRVLAERGCLGPPIGLGMMLAAPTIVATGSPDQIRRLVPPILSGQVAWCQLFSEPNAGSDLAGLQCRAERDGDEWVVTGQKVWTSLAQFADMGMLLARTDPTKPKHAGISYFALSMAQPGVTVRPLREMSGRALFNEVFIDEGRVPDRDLIGGPGAGWKVANATLGFERDRLGSPLTPLPAVQPGPLAGNLDRTVVDALASPEIGDEGVPDVGPEVLEHCIRLARSLGRNTDPVLRDALMRLFELVEVNRLSGLRAVVPDAVPGHANLAKLATSELYRQFRDVGNQIIGPAGMLSAEADLHGGSIQEITAFSPAPAILGGTDQVQRNVIGERVLGLPKEPGPSPETPFADLPKN